LNVIVAQAVALSNQPTAVIILRRCLNETVLFCKLWVAAGRLLDGGTIDDFYLHWVRNDRVPKALAAIGCR
jgi:hypothetical protein